MRTLTSWTLIVFLVVASLAQPAVAATETWDGDTDALWSTNTNWADDSAPVDGDDLVFGTAANQSTTNDLLTNVNSILFNTGDFALTGTALTINTAAGINNNVNGFNSVSLNLVLGTAATFQSIATGGAVLFINGTIATVGNTLTIDGSGNTILNRAVSGAGGLTKSGAGTVQLAGVNTYTGTTTVNAGVVDVSSGDAIADAGAVVIAAGGTVRISSGSETIGSLDGTGSVGLGGNRLITGGNNTSTSFAGVISGAGGVTKEGTGTFTLSGANTFTGDLVINNGVVSLDGSAAVADTAQVDIGAGGTLNLVLEETIGSLTGSGAITNNGNQLTTGGNNASTTYSGVMTGGAGFTKEGTGTFTLSGANAYGGITFVNAGTLSTAGGAAIPDFGDVVLAAGATLDLAASETIGVLLGAGAVTLNANTLTLGRDGAPSFAATGVISGAGGLTKVAGNQFTLSGANTYTGTTTVNGGILSLSGGAAIVDTGAVVTASGARLNLLAAETIGSLDGAGLVTLNANTLTTGGNNASTTASGVISGTGGLTKVGTGNFTLSAVNTYTGTTTVNGGTLTLAGGAAIVDTGTVVQGAASTVALAANETLGSIASAAADATLALGANALTVGGNNTSTTFEGAITGTGALVKGGTGVLTLAGANTFTGTTTINAGTLALDDGAAIADTAAVVVNAGGTLGLVDAETIGSLSGAGAVALGTATLTAGANNASTTYSGVMSGTGGFTKVGTGTVSFTGANTYTGLTSIQDGVFENNGSLASNVEVGVAGRYRGSGSVGNAVFRGTVAPGNSIGTTVVAGNATFDSTATYEAEVNADGRSDLIQVAGTAALGNATVRVIQEPGTFGFRQRFTILTAAGGLTGTFGQVVGFDAGFRAALANEGVNVILTLDRILALATSAATVNQRLVGTVIDQMVMGNEVAPRSDLETVLEQAGLLSAAQQQSLLSQLAPEVNAQATTAALQTGTMFSQTVLLRQAALRSRKQSERERGKNGTSTAHAAAGSKMAVLTATAAASAMVSTSPEPAREWEVWGLGFDMQGKVDPNGNAAGARFTSSGFNLGASRDLGDQWLVGVNVGSADGRVRRNGFADNVGIDATNFGAFASYEEGDLSVDLQAGVIDNDFRSTRIIAVGPISRIASATYSGDEFYALAEAGWLAIDREWQVRPTLSVAARNFDESAYTETGAGDLSLAVRGRDTDSFQSGLGVRVSRRFQGDRGGWWEPEVKIRWQHEFNETERLVTSSFVGSARTFQTLGRPVDSDSLQSRVGVSGRTESGVEVNASYFREDSSGFELDGIVGQATVRF